LNLNSPRNNSREKKLFYGKILVGDEVMFRVRAFTLVELLIVIIIVSVLATIAIPKVNESWRRASESSLRSRLKIFRDAMDRFYADCGCYPISISDIGSQTPPSRCYTDHAFGTRALVASTWRGPYLRNQAGSDENRFLHSHYRGLQMILQIRITGGSPRPRYNYFLGSSSGTVLALNGTDISTW
jgi:prepilin-type N-terminal cleavage/methylation domain-containing protein